MEFFKAARQVYLRLETSLPMIISRWFCVDGPSQSAAALALCTGSDMLMFRVLHAVRTVELRRLRVSLFDPLLADIRALFRSKMRKYLKQRSPSSLRNMLGAPPMGVLSRDHSTITFLC